MKRKLVIAMIVIGGALTTLQAVMLGVYLHSQDALAVETQEQANRTAEETNAELQAQYDKAVELREKGIVETAFETPSLQKDFDAGKLDEAALQAKMSPVVDITWIFRNSWIVTTAIITLFTFLALFVAAAVLWFRDDSLPITWAEGLTYAGALLVPDRDQRDDPGPDHQDLGQRLQDKRHLHGAADRADRATCWAAAVRSGGSGTGSWCATCSSWAGTS